jgi:putative transposase
MHFDPTKIYHVYNFASERKQLFLNKSNYLYFLNKVRNEWLSLCEVLCYCLTPAGFNFVLAPNNFGCTYVALKEKELHLQYLSAAIGKTLSSYTQAINKQHRRSGAMFNKKTKAKEIYSFNEPPQQRNTLVAAVEYIHQLPVRSGFVSNANQWEFSSSQDYYGLRRQTICNISLIEEATGRSRYDLASSRKWLSAQLFNSLFESARGADISRV